VDSISIPCFYSRHYSDTNVVDTLLVEVITYLDAKSVYTFSGMTPYYGTDKVYFFGLKRDAKLNYVVPTTSTNTKVNRYKILLTRQTAKDTIDGINYIEFKTPLTSFGYNVAAATFRFKPGYKWTPNKDTLNTNLNELDFLSIQENGPNTFLTYIINNYNFSYLIDDFAMYDPTDDWYKSGLYVPSFVFLSYDFMLQNHIISFKLTAQTVNCKEITSLNNEMSVFPNPADKAASISFNISNDANTSFQLSDLTGRVFFSENIKTNSAGSQDFSFNTSRLANGIYYCTLQIDEEKITRKLVVSH
jgi:hypothetical protein